MDSEELNSYITTVLERGATLTESPDEQERSRGRFMLTSAAGLETLLGNGGEASFDYCKTMANAVSGDDTLAQHAPEDMLDGILDSL